MPRWYIPFNCHGDPRNLFKQVRATVRSCGLNRVVPAMRFERHTGFGSFYAFVAVDSDFAGEVPHEAQILLGLPALQNRLDGTLTLADIRQMSTGDLDVEVYESQIPYILSEADSTRERDPLAASHPDLSDEEESNLVESSHHYDRLLRWLSAAGKGNWLTFRSACRALGLDTTGVQAGQILRKLRLLGHLECSFQHNEWAVAPSVLGEMPGNDGAKHYVLHGQRDETLLAKLALLGNLRVDPQTGVHGPPRVQFTVRNDEELTELAAQNINLHISENVGLTLGIHTPEISQWKAQLQSIAGITPYLYDMRRYLGGSFVPEPFDEEQSGLYEFWDQGDGETMGSSPRYTLYYDAVARRWLRGDWYGLRFLALQDESMKCEARYDQGTGDFAVAEDYHWPELYERALVLSSGLLPRHFGRWLIYGSIPSELVALLKQKINFNLHSDLPK